jgi:hypothetical protein
VVACVVVRVDTVIAGKRRVEIRLDGRFFLVGINEAKALTFLAAVSLDTARVEAALRRVVALKGLVASAVASWRNRCGAPSGVF